MVDVRTVGEFDTGNVKVSVNIPLNRLEYAIGEFKNKKNIIVFCQSGARAGQAKKILRKNGFPNVINGGGWESVNQVIWAFDHAPYFIFC
ncbi:phage shock protein E [Pedobacter sp. UYEF25]